MQVLSLGFEDCGVLTVTVNLVALAGVIAIAVVAYRLFGRFGILPGRKIQVDSIKLGCGFPSFTIRVDRRERELAYALWVELGTRKAALPFDDEYDVISEVYDSWYTFFCAARELMRQIPPRPSKGDDTLVFLTEEILNNGMRPHLTRWQAAFRRWYEQALAAEANKGKSPQEIQREFPEYDELVAELKRANETLQGYRDTLGDIIRKG